MTAASILVGLLLLATVALVLWLSRPRAHSCRVCGSWHRDVTDLARHITETHVEIR